MMVDIDDGQVVLSLESNVKRRKKSLISVLNRRLVRSLHEVEVCTEEYEGNNHYNIDNKMMRRSLMMEKINVNNYGGCSNRNYQFKSMRDIKRVYYYNQNLPHTGYMKFFYTSTNQEKLEEFYQECHKSRKYDTLV